ncbi:MAG: response regulator [Bdellovibrionota bacterium]|nr:response regulator [Bdellovibrionota bacterium]
MRKALLVGPKDVVFSSLSKLMNSQFELIHLKNAKEALTLLMEENFDVVVLPLEMDQMDGLQLINIVRNSFCINANIKIALITSELNIGRFFKKEAAPDIVLNKNEKLPIEFKKFIDSLPKENREEFNVLYLEDDLFAQKMIRMWIDKTDFIKVEFCLGVEDYKLVMNKKYDLIVCDNLLVDGESKDVAALTKNSLNSETPFLVYTATVEKVDQGFMQTQTNLLAVLEKPFEMSIFLDHVEKLRTRA